MTDSVVQFRRLPIAGAFEVSGVPNTDERGSFTRVWAATTFAKHGLAPQLAETSVSRTARRGTLRGLHFQVPPHAEAKLVTCLRGSMWDVIVDLRSGSPTYRTWHGEDLAEGRPTSLYVPEGCAHGFIATSDDVVVLYQISAPYDAAHAHGVRWDDPSFSIAWPLVPSLVSERDRSFPDFIPRSSTTPESTP